MDQQIETYGLKNLFRITVQIRNTLKSLSLCFVQAIPGHDCGRQTSYTSITDNKIRRLQQLFAVTGICRLLRLRMRAGCYMVAHSSLSQYNKGLRKICARSVLVFWHLNKNWNVGKYIGVSRLNFWRKATRFCLTLWPMLKLVWVISPLNPNKPSRSGQKW